MSIADVRVGDAILAGSVSGEQVFSEVLYLPHESNDETSTFVELLTSHGDRLRLTESHLLPSAPCTILINFHRI